MVSCLVVCVFNRTSEEVVVGVGGGMWAYLLECQKKKLWVCGGMWAYVLEQKKKLWVCSGMWAYVLEYQEEFVGV